MCNIIHKHTHTHAHGEKDTPMLGYADSRRLGRRGTQDRQGPYISGDVPVECVRFMPVSLTTAARGPGNASVQALNGNRPKSNHLVARNHPRKDASPICVPNPYTCAHEKRPTGVQLPALQPTNARFTPGRGKLGRPLQKTRRSNRYGVCCKCGDLYTNLSRHSSGCDRTPSDTIPPHSDGLGGEPSARNPATPSTPAAESSNQSEQSSPSILLSWRIEDVGRMLDALDGTTLARMSLTAAKAVWQEHRMPFARSLRHALRIFCQAHNAL